MELRGDFMGRPSHRDVNISTRVPYSLCIFSTRGNQRCVGDTKRNNEGGAALLWYRDLAYPDRTRELSGILDIRNGNDAVKNVV